MQYEASLESSHALYKKFERMGWISLTQVGKIPSLWEDGYVHMPI